MQGPSFAIALQLRILSLTETVEICLCRLPLQVAKYHESADGDVAVVRAASQSFLHCLGVVHLAIAHDTLFPSKPFVTAVGILDKLLRRNEFYAAIHNIPRRYFRGVCMLAYQFQFRGKRPKWCLNTVTVTQPHRRYFFKQSEQTLYFAPAGVTVLGAEIVDIFQVVLASDNRLGIE